MAKSLTKSQREILDVIKHHAGRKVDILCGNKITSMDPNFRPVAVSTHAALRGLEARGLIRATYFWRGATVELVAEARGEH